MESQVMNKYYSQESERLYYRKLQLSDTSDWMSFFPNNDRLHFLGLDVSKPHDVLANEWIEKQLERYALNQFGLLCVCSKETNDMVGMAGIIPRHIEKQDLFEIGYSFLPTHWKKGYATEAATCMKAFGLTNKVASRFISIIHEDNVDSMKVAERNGLHPIFNTTYMGMNVVVYG